MRFYQKVALKYITTPLQEIQHHSLEKAGIRLLIKREDLNHPHISGNKWWKLKYNLQEARHQNKKTLLTFGGAFSNHICATAAAAREEGFKSLGVIRGEKTLPLNPTLKFAEEQGMEIHYITREDYRKKNENEFIQNLVRDFGDFFLIPEGGTNTLAVKGCAEYAEQELATVDFDHLILPVGTGGTMTGLICGFKGSKNIIGVSVLKNGEFLNHDIEKLINDFSGKSFGNWSILTSYHHGGYAKVTDALLLFIKAMMDENNLPLDQVYTGKLLWAVMKEIENGNFKRGSTILVLHTGGLQILHSN